MTQVPSPSPDHAEANPAQTTQPTTHTTHPLPFLSRAGKVRTGILMWALGVPVSLVLLFLVIRGCVG